MSKPTIEARLEKLSDLTGEELTELEKDIEAAYDAADESDDLDTMDKMVANLETVYAHRDSASETKTEQPEAETESKDDVKAEDAKPDEGTEDDEKGEDTEEESADPDQESNPKAPKAEDDDETDKTIKEEPEPEAKVEDVTSADAAPEAEAEATTTTAEEKLPMAASGTPDFQPPEDSRPVVASAATAVRVGADIQGFSAGTDFSDLRSVNEAFVQKLNAIKRSSGGNGEQLSVATVVASIPEDRLLSRGDVEENAAKIEAVTSEQAIIASGGYCAPLAVKYDIFGMGSTARPIRDGLPAFGATRGGIRYVSPPKLGDYTDAIGLWTSQIDADAGGGARAITNKELTANVATLTSANHGFDVGQKVVVEGVDATFDGTYTITAVTVNTFSYDKVAANVVSAAATGTAIIAPKSCLKVNCAAELTADVDAVTLCLEFGNLMSRAYPELVARHNALALVQHARYAEQNLLNQIGAASVAVTSGFELGVARDFLFAIGRAAAAYRNRHRVSRLTPLRVIAPEWVLDAMREDLAQQMPGDATLDTADSVITRYLAARNVNVTWHMDDTFANQTAGALVDFPATIKWHIFAEGTFLFLDGGTLDLGVIRDSQLVGTNDYKTFVETFEGVAKVGLESVQVTTTTRVEGSARALTAVS